MNSFPNETEHGYKLFPNNANVTNFTTNELTNPEYVRNNDNHSNIPHIDNVDSIAKLSTVETYSPNNELESSSLEHKIELKYIDYGSKSHQSEKSSTDKKNNVEKEITIQKRKANTQINSKHMDEQNSLSSDSKVNNKNLNAQEESKITHKKAIFVGVLISLARKRMK